LHTSWLTLAMSTKETSQTSTTVSRIWVRASELESCTRFESMSPFLFRVFYQKAFNNSLYLLFCYRSSSAPSNRLMISHLQKENKFNNFTTFKRKVKLLYGVLHAAFLTDATSYLLKTYLLLANLGLCLPQPSVATRPRGLWKSPSTALLTRSGSVRPKPSVCKIENRFLIQMVSIVHSASGDIAKATVGLHD
jgi:hypothetical protein